ncbi:ABC transporter substrate-binding protein [Rhodococcoides fascians]|uniref:ABC transporter substrate-binding protein n=1 Tax=Rhodococcoides fascians TaxID=1828 RepID=UPI00050C928A|nr:ABC transporter substrate-binding protein [Rhodococcus fascians]
MRSYNRSLGWTALAAVVSLVGISCGSTHTTATETATGTPAAAEGTVTYPLTIDNCGYEQTFTEPPKRVLLMQGASVGEVETLIHLGLEDSVLANTQHYGVSDTPGMVEKVDALPTGDIELNAMLDVPAEQALAAKPDLIISTYSGGFDSKFGFASRETLADAGINSIVNPVNCGYAKPDNVTPEEEEAYRNGSVESSLEFIELIGQIFDVEERAATVSSELRERIDAVRSAVADEPKKNMLIAFPDMAMMNANGLPAVFSGNIYDSVVESAGGEPVFRDGGWGLTSSLSAEQLAAADVDTLVIGAYKPNEDLDAEAAKLFAAYPQWTAAQNNSYVKVSDGIYLGPANADAIEKIAKVAHPDAFQE